MTEHTPGPWRIEGDGDWFDVFGDRGVVVAETMMEPDARLIAAAPDLLAALRTCLCPAGGWNGMPEHLEGICTVQDCVTAGTCGCDCGEAIAKVEKTDAA